MKAKNVHDPSWLNSHWVLIEWYRRELDNSALALKKYELWETTIILMQQSVLNFEYCGTKYTLEIYYIMLINTFKIIKVG